MIQPSKNSGTLTLGSKGSPNAIWDNANYTWNDATGTWKAPITVFVESTKNTATLTLSTKN